MTALGFAVVYEQVDGRGARFDQDPAPEVQETEEQYEHHQLHDEFFDDLCTLLFGGLHLGFGIGEFDVDHVVVVVVAFCDGGGGGGGNRFVAFLADEGAGDFVRIHDVRSIREEGTAIDQRERGV
jgi:hypothetical protein